MSTFLHTVRSAKFTIMFNKSGKNPHLFCNLQYYFKKFPSSIFIVKNGWTCTEPLRRSGQINDRKDIGATAWAACDR